MVLRVIGALFILAALVAAGMELVQWFSSGTYKPMTLGGLWYMFHRASLNASQAVIQRYIAPWLWDPTITWVLIQPVWATAGLPGAVLVWLGWRKKKNRRPRSRG